jgi:hypothetical protein
MLGFMVMSGSYSVAPTILQRQTTNKTAFFHERFQVILRLGKRPLFEKAAQKVFANLGFRRRNQHGPVKNFAFFSKKKPSLPRQLNPQP